MKNDIQQILDGGSCSKGIESNIIGFKNEDPVIYRLGVIALEEIETIVGKISVKNKEEESLMLRNVSKTLRPFDRNFFSK